MPPTVPQSTPYTQWIRAYSISICSKCLFTEKSKSRLWQGLRGGSEAVVGGSARYPKSPSSPCLFFPSSLKAHCRKGGYVRKTELSSFCILSQSLNCFCIFSQYRQVIVDLYLTIKGANGGQKEPVLPSIKLLES